MPAVATTSKIRGFVPPRNLVGKGRLVAASCMMGKWSGMCRCPSFCQDTLERGGLPWHSEKMDVRIRPAGRRVLAYAVVGETFDRLPRNQCWRAADRTERGDGRKALSMNSSFICSSSEEASPRTSRSTVCAR